MSFLKCSVLDVVNGTVKALFSIVTVSLLCASMSRLLFFKLWKNNSYLAFIVETNRQDLVVHF